MFVMPPDRSQGEPIPVQKLDALIPYLLGFSLLFGLLLMAVVEGEMRPPTDHALHNSLHSTLPFKGMDGKMIARH
jgi:hypothetical protein